VHHDDRKFKDEWQLEVYLYALGMMKKYNLNSIIDIGCGSGYKLITYLGEYDTLGIELPENVAWLQEKYPNRKWLSVEFSEGEKLKLAADLVICADVIEHLVEPNELLSFIKSINHKYCIISTPCRSLRFLTWRDFLRLRWVRKLFGPPGQLAHVREWSFKEFRNYISLHLNIIEQKITNLTQATQMVVCKPKL
jgi:SAM-dependent methyltransferase